MFYGWVLLAAATVAAIASIPGQTIGVGVFEKYLRSTLGLSSVQLTLAYAVGTIGSSFILPFAGSLLDRVGSRVMATVAAGGLGVSLVLLSQCDRLAGRLGHDSSYVAMGVSCVCFLLIRFFGQGCLTLTSRVAIGNWFDHRRGLASAISGVFVAFAFNGSPKLLNDLVQAFGWREACLLLAAIVGVGMTLVGWVFFRDNPEQCGLVMDGVTDEAWHAKMAARVPDVHKEFTRGEAARTWAFWAFNMGVAAQALVMTAVTFHIAAVGAEMNLDREACYALFLPMATCSIVANFIGGWASDRIKLKWVLVAMMGGQALGITGLLDLGDATGRAMFVVGLGVSNGLFVPLTTVTWPRFFGREHLGAISGLNVSVMVFASAIGPVLFAKGRELTGSFRVVEVLCWFMPVAIMFAGLRAENPQHRLSPPSE